MKTSTEFHRVIIFVEKSNFVFMQYYSDKEEHNFKTDLPHGSSRTNTRSHKRTKESVNIAIKESIFRLKDVVNDFFQHAGGALGVKYISDFPKSRQQVKDLRRNKCPGDEKIKLIETCKNEMMNKEKAFIRSVDTSPEKVIFVASNQQLTDLARFCTDPRKFCIISVDWY